jgi:hypothetical protein
VIAAALVALLSGSLAGAGAEASTRAPAHLLVYAQEWSLWASRTSLPPGRVIVELWNRGQDAHDLRVQRLVGHRTSGPVQGVRATLPGAIGTATWHLGPGRYELYCSMPGHLQMGMHTVIVVR